MFNRKTFILFILIGLIVSMIAVAPASAKPDDCHEHQGNEDRCHHQYDPCQQKDDRHDRHDRHHGHGDDEDKCQTPEPVSNTATVDPIFGCDVTASFTGPAPWVIDGAGNPIPDSWAILNGNLTSYRIGADLFVTEGSHVKAGLTNGVQTYWFDATKEPATCTPL